MSVSELMKREVATVTPNDDVATAVRIMREHRCGFVPVVDSHGSVIGVVTDRDLCLVTASEKHRTMERIAVKDAMSHPVFSCLADEDLKVALATMAQRHVRRLPVLDGQGHLHGVLSIDDIIRASGVRGVPSAQKIVEALKLISAPRPIESAVA